MGGSFSHEMPPAAALPTMAMSAQLPQHTAAAAVGGKPPWLDAAPDLPHPDVDTLLGGTGIWHQLSLDTLSILTGDPGDLSSDDSELLCDMTTAQAAAAAAPRSGHLPLNGIALQQQQQQQQQRGVASAAAQLGASAGLLDVGLGGVTRPTAAGVAHGAAMGGPSAAAGAHQLPSGGQPPITGGTPTATSTWSHPVPGLRQTLQAGGGEQQGHQLGLGSQQHQQMQQQQYIQQQQQGEPWPLSSGQSPPLSRPHSASQAAQQLLQPTHSTLCSPWGAHPAASLSPSTHPMGPQMQPQQQQMHHQQVEAHGTWQLDHVGQLGGQGEAARTWY
jgi:hypothetical protein